eukprot:Clim_evm8s206 gene=Clim_evmTU8s206
MHVVILHNEMLLGGAERLVVDAARALQRSRIPRAYDPDVTFVEQSEALRKEEITVNIFTTRHDPDRAFTETVDGTVPVKVLGAWIPRGIFGMFTALFAYLRMLYMCFMLWIHVYLHHNYVDGRSYATPDLIFIDQVSIGIPLLRALFPNAPVIFYLHFPDKLQTTTSRSTALGRFYRVFVDAIEAWSTLQADALVANSQFAARNALEQFPTLRDEEIVVIYPTVTSGGGVDDERPAGSNVDDAAGEAAAFARGLINRQTKGKESSNSSRTTVPKSPQTPKGKATKASRTEGTSKPTAAHLPVSPNRSILQALVDGPLADIPLFVSINRYETKKRIDRAIRALHALRSQSKGVDGARSARLVIAGGYDPDNRDNRRCSEELVMLAKDLGLSVSYSASSTKVNAQHATVIFLRNVSEEEKEVLLQRATAIVYTPEDEHFGIVPLEAMRVGCPALAVASGGPLETILDGQTGKLCRGQTEAELVQSFASGMQWAVTVYDNLSLRIDTHILCKEHVEEHFGFHRFQRELVNLMRVLLHPQIRRERYRLASMGTVWLIILLVAALPVVYYLTAGNA